MLFCFKKPIRNKQFLRRLFLTFFSMRLKSRSMPILFRGLPQRKWFGKMQGFGKKYARFYERKIFCEISRRLDLAEWQTRFSFVLETKSAYVGEQPVEEIKKQFRPKKKHSFVKIKIITKWYFFKSFLLVIQNKSVHLQPYSQKDTKIKQC